MLHAIYSYRIRDISRSISFFESFFLRACSRPLASVFFSLFFLFCSFSSQPVAPVLQCTRVRSYSSCADVEDRAVKVHSDLCRAVCIHSFFRAFADHDESRFDFVSKPRRALARSAISTLPRSIASQEREEKEREREGERGRERALRAFPSF